MLTLGLFLFCRGFSCILKVFNLIDRAVLRQFLGSVLTRVFLTDMCYIFLEFIPIIIDIFGLFYKKKTFPSFLLIFAKNFVTPLLISLRNFCPTYFEFGGNFLNKIPIILLTLWWIYRFSTNSLFNFYLLYVHWNFEEKKAGNGGKSTKRGETTENSIKNCAKNTEKKSWETGQNKQKILEKISKKIKKNREKPSKNREKFR